MKEKGLAFLANWSKPEHLNRISTIGLRGIDNISIISCH
jgi:hypothetical protein